MARWRTWALIALVGGGLSTLSLLPLGAQEKAPLTAEEEEAGGPLVRLLENLLSGDNRNIEVVGLDGALSSRATIERLVVSDDRGVWLEVKEAVLDWNRLALVRGRFSVNDLSAREITVTRRPDPPANPPPPTLEAKPFALPELPVSVEIAQIGVERIALGNELAGQDAALALRGDLTLADGILDTDIALDRLDRQGDRASLQASFVNETRQIELDLDLRESAGGLIGTLLQLPDSPALELSAKGSGPTSDFTADLALLSDGQERFGGQVTLRADPETAGKTDFGLDLGGDLRALMDPAYHDFFGPRTAVSLNGSRDADGALSVPALRLSAQALDLGGALSLSAARDQAMVVMNGQMGLPDARPVTLPGAQINSAELALNLDTARSEGWQMALRLEGLEAPDLALAEARLGAQGTVDLTEGLALRGALEGAINGIKPRDPALQSALGDDLTLSGDFTRPASGTLNLSGWQIAAQNLSAQLDARIDGLSTGFPVEGRAALELPDLAPFSGLAGRDLSGALSAELTGNGVPLGGAFDMTLRGTGHSLGVGMEQLDPLLAGDTQLDLAARRDENGVALRQLTLKNTALDVDIAGEARAGGARLTVAATLDDLARVLPEQPGPVTLSGTVTQKARDWASDLTLTAPGAAKATLQAALSEGGQAGLDLDLSLSETAGGPISGLLKMPERPALALKVTGDGSLADFNGALNVASDGVERVRGTIGLSQTEQQQSARAKIEGDLTPFLPLGFQDFFGPESDLALQVIRQQDGRTRLEQLDLRSAALSLTGDAVLSAENLPESLRLSAKIADPEGDAVRLPLPGAPVTVRQADLSATLRATPQGTWQAGLNATGLSTAEAGIEQTRLSADGTIDISDALSLSGQVQAALSGLIASDPRLAAALGESARLEADFDLSQGTQLEVKDLQIQAAGSTISGTATVQDLDTEPDLSTALRLETPALSRFSALAGLSLSGGLKADLNAEYALSDQQFNARLNAQGDGLETGIAQADALLAGPVTAQFQGDGTPDQIDIRTLNLTSAALSSDLTGLLAKQDSNLRASVRLDNLGRVLAQVSGPATLSAEARQSGRDWNATATLEAPASNAELSANTKGELIDLTYDLRIDQLARFLPGFGGTLTATGSARKEGPTWQASSQLDGPAGFNATLEGGFDTAAQQAKGTARGALELGAINGLIRPNSVQGQVGFDLAIDGAPALEAVSGDITLNGIDVAIPAAQTVINDFGGALSLQQGNASVDLKGDIREGGGFAISGPVSLSAPYEGSITTTLNQIVMTDKLAYETVLGGELLFAGPLAGDARLSGQIDVGETRINVAAAAGGAAAIPEISHVGDTAGVRATRSRAGLDAKSGSGGSAGPNIGLDVTISAPKQVYVKGYGLNAELGGAITIGGSTRNIAPSGRIDLLRGSLNLLGRNLELTKGLVTMQGSLSPYMDFAATSNTQEGSATMQIVGELSDLQINISADPDRPEEEALAMLIFGNEFARLSPVRIAQMALYTAQLRSGSDPLTQATGADRASLSEDSSGSAALGVGGYVSENIYTDVSVNAQGDAELNINLDISENLTIKGSVDNEGETGLGLFFERDY